MKQNHMIGITPAHDNPDFALMREMGVKWVRQGYPFPFSDEKGTLSKNFLHADKLNLIRFGLFRFGLSQNQLTLFYKEYKIT